MGTEQEMGVGRVPDGTGLSQAEPQEGLRPTGFDPSRDDSGSPAGLTKFCEVPGEIFSLWELTGYVEEVHPKCGLRAVRFGALRPYQHTAFIDVTGDPGAEDDDSLNRDLEPFCSGLVCVLAAVNEDGELFATPSRFRKVARDSDGSPKGRDREDGLDGEAATARAEGIAQAEGGTA